MITKDKMDDILFKTWMVFIIVIFTSLISCKSQNLITSELPPKIFKNFNEANEYLAKNVEAKKINYKAIFGKFNERFENSMYSDIVLADLDKDGIYEFYINRDIGSGIYIWFISGYNPITKEEYILEKRGKAHYRLFIYEEELYVLEGDFWHNPYKKSNAKIYRPILFNEKLTLDDIEEKLHNAIKESISFFK